MARELWCNSSAQSGATLVQGHVTYGGATAINDAFLVLKAEGTFEDIVLHVSSGTYSSVTIPEDFNAATAETPIIVQGAETAACVAVNNEGIRSNVAREATCVIDGSLENGRCVTAPVNENIVFQNFTIQNGTTTELGGCTTGAKFENCVIKHGLASGGGGCVSQSSLSRCVLDDGALGTANSSQSSNVRGMLVNNTAAVEIVCEHCVFTNTVTTSYWTSSSPYGSGSDSTYVQGGVYRNCTFKDMFLHCKRHGVGSAKLIGCQFYAITADEYKSDGTLDNHGRDARLLQDSEVDACEFLNETGSITAGIDPEQLIRGVSCGYLVRNSNDSLPVRNCTFDGGDDKDAIRVDQSLIYTTGVVENCVFKNLKWNAWWGTSSSSSSPPLINSQSYASEYPISKCTFQDIDWYMTSQPNMPFISAYALISECGFYRINCNNLFTATGRYDTGPLVDCVINQCTSVVRAPTKGTRAFLESCTRCTITECVTSENGVQPLMREGTCCTIKDNIGRLSGYGFSSCLIVDNSCQTNGVTEFARDAIYRVGEFCLNGGVLYRCVREHRNTYWSASDFEQVGDFSNSVDYDVGDYCLYGGLLFKCIASHSAGAWSAADFEQVIASFFDGDTINHCTVSWSKSDIPIPGIIERAKNSIIIGPAIDENMLDDNKLHLERAECCVVRGAVDVLPTPGGSEYGGMVRFTRNCKRADPKLDDEYRLQFGSPAIHAVVMHGNDYEYMTLDGKKWHIPRSMGCYEYDGEAMMTVPGGGMNPFGFQYFDSEVIAHRRMKMMKLPTIDPD